MRIVQNHLSPPTVLSDSFTLTSRVQVLSQKPQMAAWLTQQSVVLFKNAKRHGFQSLLINTHNSINSLILIDSAQMCFAQPSLEMFLISSLLEQEFPHKSLSSAVSAFLAVSLCINLFTQQSFYGCKVLPYLHILTPGTIYKWPYSGSFVKTGSCGITYNLDSLGNLFHSQTFMSVETNHQQSCLEISVVPFLFISIIRMII